MREYVRGKAEGTSVGVQINAGQPHLQGEVGRGEIWEAISKLRVGKASGIDDVTAEMVKHGGDITVEWMLWICSSKGAGRCPGGVENGLYCTAEQGKTEQEWLQQLQGNNLTSACK